MSNEGSSFYYLSKNEPPLINLPVCGAKVPVRQPQQVIFSWLPRNTSSPASAGETQYEFSLYEIRPEGRNPNDVVLSSQPVFKTTIDYTQLVYGPAEYETRAQAKKMGSPGPYTDIIKFRTLPVTVAHCGDPALLPEGGPGEPFREAIKRMTVEVQIRVCFCKIIRLLKTKSYLRYILFWIIKD